MRHKAWYHKATSTTVLIKTIIAVITTVMLFLPRVTFQRHGGLLGHVFFPLSHANVFHLAANLMCLWMIKFNINYTQAFFVSFVASFIPAPTFQYATLSFQDIPTCGLSGFLMAAVADRYAQCTSVKVTMKYLVLPVFIASLLPSINLLFHMYSIVIAFAFTRIRMHISPNSPLKSTLQQKN